MSSVRKLVLFALATTAWATLMFGSAAVAQPLVTGDLLLYYDFDEIVHDDPSDEDRFLDESGNDFYGTINVGDESDVTPGTLTLETTDVKRGAGAALFTQSTTDEIDFPVFVDVHGADITANHFDLLPASTGSFTLSAWVNVNETGGDQSVFQGRTGDGGHGNPHFQLQSGGKLRFVWRDQFGESIVSQERYTDGSEDNVDAAYPFEEWFHYAGTYDGTTDEYAMYYNGQEIIRDFSNLIPGIPPGDWGGQEASGDWFAAGFGAVYDNFGSRRLDGLMDELYVFSRALTAEEVLALFEIPPPGDNADFNGDGTVDGDDFLIWQNGFGSPGDPSMGDANGDGNVDGDDFLIWQNQFGGPPPGGAAGAVPEPGTVGLLVLAGFACAALRKRLA